MYNALYTYITCNYYHCCIIKVLLYIGRRFEVLHNIAGTLTAYTVIYSATKNLPALVPCRACPGMGALAGRQAAPGLGTLPSSQASSCQLWVGKLARLQPGTLTVRLGLFWSVRTQKISSVSRGWNRSPQKRPATRSHRARK